jgi:hypothetical protein
VSSASASGDGGQDDDSRKHLSSPFGSATI